MRGGRLPAAVTQCCVCVTMGLDNPPLPRLTGWLPRSGGAQHRMQYDNSDDPFGFWDDEPTRALTRTHVGTRSHGDTAGTTGMIPVVRAASARPPAPTRPQRNPLVTRIALLVGVMLLFVPIALSLRSGNPHLRAADFKPVETISIGQLPPAPIALTEAPTTSALATTAAIVTEAVVVTP